MVQLDSLTLIQWIEIYPMDNAIHLLNNWGEVNRKTREFEHYHNNQVQLHSKWKQTVIKNLDDEPVPQQVDEL